MLAGHFRRSTRLDDDAETRRFVARAVARAKQGDQEALRFLYVRYADNVYGYVASLLRDDHEAEDVTQHVFAKLMTNLPQVRAARGPVLRVDPARGAQRRRRPHAPAPRDPVRGGPRAASYESRRRRLAARGIAERGARRRCPAEQREVLVLRHLVGLSPGEIADAHGQDRAVDPRAAPPRPRRAARRAGRAQLRADGAREGSMSSPTLGWSPIPITRLDQADPALVEELLEVVARVAWKGAFSMGSELDAFEDGVRRLLRAPARRRRLLRDRGARARAAGPRHRPRRRGDRPDELVHRHGRGGQPRRRDAAARRRRPRDAPAHGRGASRPRSARARAR